MIFDTSFIIDLMEKDASAVQKLKDAINNGEIQAVTSPTIFELYSGLAQSRLPELERKKILLTLSNLLVWDLDVEGAARGGEIDGSLISAGAKIEPIDSMIAGIALSRGEKLLTRNTKHFSSIPGLKVETY